MYEIMAAVSSVSFAINWNSSKYSFASKKLLD